MHDDTDKSAEDTPVEETEAEENAEGTPDAPESPDTAADEETPTTEPPGDTGAETQPPAAPAMPESEAFLQRALGLQQAIEQTVAEKEERRQAIEQEFQETQKRLKDLWDQTQQEYDNRIGALQRELFKTQGIYEYLKQQEDAPEPE